VEDNETMDHGVILVDSNLEVTSKTLQLPVTERLLSKGQSSHQMRGVILRQGSND
ncbi:hypothetical protein CEXT_662971, partial [Caerostris extrusa]